MLFNLLAFGFLAASSVAGTATRVAQSEGLSVVPEFLGDRAPRMVAPETVARVMEDRMSNAVRMRRGLPIKPPHHRERNVVRDEKPSSTLTTRTGYIKVTTTTGNAEFLGYLAINSNTGLFKVSQSDGVLVKIPYNPAANVWRANIETINGYTEYTFVGGIQGAMSPSSDVGSTKPNYLSLGAVVETASLAPPTPGLNSLSAPNSADIESAIVMDHHPDNNIYVDWVNSDSSKPGVFLVYHTATGAFLRSYWKSA
ncbi:hypothetical protein CPB85DRAFT_1568874 [Mucidula mucida]|nr:hypothetical protein CPB85DRAFT_1568874 [Mucidula mucida]